MMRRLLLMAFTLILIFVLYSCGGSSDAVLPSDTDESQDSRSEIEGLPMASLSVILSVAESEIFERSTMFDQLGSDIDGDVADDYSGVSVSLSSDGHIVAIGASRHDGDTGLDFGQVSVFELTGSEWTPRGSDIVGEAAGDQSGFTVSLSSDGNIVAIGATQNDGVNGVDSVRCPCVCME